MARPAPRAACWSAGFLVAALAACAPATQTPGDSGTEPAPIPEPGPRATCPVTAMSTLQGLWVEFPEQPCSYTLAQAAAGIQFRYEVISEQNRPLWDEQPAGGCVRQVPLAGLPQQVRIQGNGQLFCHCDVGPCGGGYTRRSNVVRGRHALEAAWNGRNWLGPSDISAPMGDPFPPGRYAFVVASKALTDEGFPFSVDARLEFDLVP